MEAINDNRSLTPGYGGVTDMESHRISLGPIAEQQNQARERLKARHSRNMATLQKLIADLSGALTDEGPDWSDEGLDRLRRRVANALPPFMCPDWLRSYCDPAVVQSDRDTGE